MSVEAVSYALSARITDPVVKLTLIGYADHAHKDGTSSFPSLEDTMTTYVPRSARTIQRAVATLLEEGYLREGDQRLVSHIDPRYRPIVYDVATDDATRDQWRYLNSIAPGQRRTRAAASGAAGGVSGAARRWPTRGTTSPDSPDEPPAPHAADQHEPPGVTPVSPLNQPVDNPARGDTGDAPGVTPVSPKPPRLTTQGITTPPSSQPKAAVGDARAAASPAAPGAGTRKPRAKTSRVPASHWPTLAAAFPPELTGGWDPDAPNRIGRAAAKELRHRTPEQLAERIRRRWDLWDLTRPIVSAVAVSIYLVEARCTDPRCEDGVLDDGRVCELCPEQDRQASAVARPPWCGSPECDEVTRQVETQDGRMTRCPSCHPLRVTA